jgi:hypothetical protein
MDAWKQHTQAKEREEGGRDHVVGKEEKKGQDGIQLFFFCFNLIITQARARATQNTRVFH